MKASTQRTPSLTIPAPTIWASSWLASNVWTRSGAKTLAFGLWVFLYQYRLFEVPWVWWGFVLLFFAEDFAYYCFHRASHEVRFLWAALAILVLAVGIRASRKAWYGNDFGAFHSAARAALAGKDIYKANDSIEERC